MSTGEGSVKCLDRDFHEKCAHRHYADKRIGVSGKGEDEPRKKKVMDV